MRCKVLKENKSLLVKLRTVKEKVGEVTKDITEQLGEESCLMWKR